MEYYLKKCGFQELGSVVGNGTPKRGRYLLTSKKAVSFFPALSTSQKNDSALLTVIPLYTGKKVYCNYVYHNDKYHGSTVKHPRDEYRIYLNNALEENGHRFHEEDILIFGKTERLLEDETVQPIYYLKHIKAGASGLYKRCNELIRDSGINGGYCLFEGELPEFQEELSHIQTVEQAEVSIEDSVTVNIMHQNMNDETLAKLFNASSFRDFVMTGYGNLCAVTRSVIKYDVFTNLEAAHIKPKSHNGLYLPSNGLALTRDFHWAFDKGFFTIDDDYRLRVHEMAESEYLHSFDKKEIYIPKNSFFVPKREYLQYHREHIFGLFLTSGRL